MNMNENKINVINELHRKQSTFKFRKFPGFIRLFSFTNATEDISHQIHENSNKTNILNSSNHFNLNNSLITL